VFGDIIQLMNLQGDSDPNGELEEMLDVLSRMPDSCAAELQEHGSATPPFEGRPVQFVDVRPLTPDGKVHLFPGALDTSAPAGLYGYQPDPGTPDYPLALISPASDRTITSMLSELPRPEVRLLMHPDDAGARGLTDGDGVRIFNADGEVRCKVQVGAWIRPGTTSLSKGLWRKHIANGYTANLFAPDTLTDLGGGACFNDARVQVERADRPTT
jgi:anaerobic selenocysteine-containing dehydrogenase